jgi:hypothetical protein
MSAGVVGRTLKVATLPVAARTQRQAYVTAAFTSSISTAYTAGSWAVVSASTSARFLLAQLGAASICSYSGTANPGAAWQMVTEVGVGGSGSEVVVASVVTGSAFGGSSSADPSGSAGNVVLSPMVDIPAGSRVAVRTQVQARMGAGRSVTGECDVSLWLIDPLAVL